MRGPSGASWFATTSIDVRGAADTVITRFANPEWRQRRDDEPGRSIGNIWTIKRFASKLVNEH